MSQAASSAASAIDYGTQTRNASSLWVIGLIVAGAVAIAWLLLRKK